MPAETGSEVGGGLPRLRGAVAQVIDDSNNNVFRQQSSNTRVSRSLIDQPRPRNKRDGKPFFEVNNARRGAPQPFVSFPLKRVVVASFDRTASTTATDEGETGVELQATTSLDSTSITSFGSSEFPLQKLENVTLISRSLIPPELQSHLSPLQTNKRHFQKMATPVVTSNNDGNGNDPKQSRKSMFRKKMSSKHNSSLEGNQLPEDQVVRVQVPRRSATESNIQASASITSHSQAHDEPKNQRKSSPAMEIPATAVTPQRSNAKSKSTDTVEPAPRRGMLERLRSVSRSRSRARASTDTRGEPVKPILVAVTSCRSDAYYNQKAPGSTSKLPRKAPSNLKLFHELAVGIKDAYAAVGQTPTRPPEPGVGVPSQDSQILEGSSVLWEFVGNLDFLLALVDEVAIDTATRGALKDDSMFKSLRDVIKKGNKVLEGMLVRRERRYTLFFRLVQPSELKEVAKIKSWNVKVEKAIGSVADNPGHSTSESESDAESVASSASESQLSTASSTRGGGLLSRGRQILPSAGRVRARRATPTPTLRNRGASQDSGSSAAEDGFAAGTPVTKGNLALLQKSMSKDDDENGIVNAIPALMPPPPPNQPLFANSAKPIQPKDELIDVIRGLRTEKIQKREGTAETDLQALKPNWQPKADIPSSVPKLPTEYIHRHRLMKQVVNCLLDQNGAGPRDMDEEVTGNTIITCITSRHADKPGNGKTTLAVAAIQTVEVRERFCDGIAWIQLGRNPLTEKEVRRLYEELFRQLVTRGEDDPLEDNATDDGSKEDEPPNRGDSLTSSVSNLGDVQGLIAHENAIRLAESRQRFQGGELDAIKEDLTSIIIKKKILICLDDVWRVDDAKWFIFDTRTGSTQSKPAIDQYPYRILMTSRTPALLGPGVVQEVFVRIFSEHEAVKLLLSSAGRRPYGGKQSAVFNQARVIVKGCGNSPMAVRLAGGMLRRWNRNWNLSSPTWKSLIEQCKLNLEEASRLRSFANSVTRIVDLGFACIDDMELRSVARRSFITFAVAFRDNDWLHIGKGIPQAVVLKLFAAVNNSKNLTAEGILASLETMNLLERARHGTTSHLVTFKQKDGSESDDDDFEDEEETKPTKSSFLENPSFIMQDSLRAIGEELAKRSDPAFLPESDSFTSFTTEIVEEQNHNKSLGLVGSTPMGNNENGLSEGKEAALIESGVHELLAACLAGVDGRILRTSLLETFHKTKEINKNLKGGIKLEEYLAFFLPSHLIRSQQYASAGVLLVDSQFVRRRVKALGASEATRKQVADLLELRREYAKEPLSQKSGKSQQTGPKKDYRAFLKDAVENPNFRACKEEKAEDLETVDSSLILRDGCRSIVDEVHRVVSNAKGSSESISMAICLSTVGEGLMKGKQPRDAMLRLDEAYIIYRNILGENHVDVARSLHSVARALVKAGENRVALQKFIDAAAIFDRCNATMHYDSIANSQNLASLLVDLGEWDKASKCFDDVIRKKKIVYGEGNVSVAKTINSYAILLAKHGRMNEALKNYEAAKATYEAVPPSILQDAEFEMKCKYDTTLINLNIASIRSKKGDLAGAIKSYAEGVRGLRQYEADQEKLMATTGAGETGKNTSHVKHLVAALGRIGSLKLKVGDNVGALEAYKALLTEVADDSPSASKIEAAKAHIKCATIYRQEDSPSAREKSISHLRQALEMYSVLFGANHKDTLAIGSSLRQWLAEEQEK